VSEDAAWELLRRVQKEAKPIPAIKVRGAAELKIVAD
jgi:hypothetical protein